MKKRILGYDLYGNEKLMHVVEETKRTFKVLCNDANITMLDPLGNLTKTNHDMVTCPECKKILDNEKIMIDKIILSKISQTPINITPNMYKNLDNE